MRIAIIAALPGELKPLVRGWQRVATNDSGAKKWMPTRDADTWIAVCAEWAPMRADGLMQAPCHDGPLDMLLSVGWAGALDPKLQPGTAHIPTAVIDAQTGEQFRLTEGNRDNGAW